MLCLGVHLCIHRSLAIVSFLFLLCFLGWRGRGRCWQAEIGIPATDITHMLVTSDHHLCATFVFQSQYRLIRLCCNHMRTR